MAGLMGNLKGCTMESKLVAMSASLSVAMTALKLVVK